MMKLCSIITLCLLIGAPFIVNGSWVCSTREHSCWSCECPGFGGEGCRVACAQQRGGGSVSYGHCDEPRNHDRCPGGTERTLRVNQGNAIPIPVVSHIAGSVQRSVGRWFGRLLQSKKEMESGFVETNVFDETHASESNSTSPNTDTEDSEVDVCSLPGPRPDPSSGYHCMAYFPSWYFDSSTQTCRSFIYGGCGGNANRFGTSEECIQTCGGTAAPAPLWAGRRLQKQAQEVHQEGEGIDGQTETGSASTVVETDEVDTTVAPESEVDSVNADTCSLPFEVGPCKAAISAWFFAPSTQTCEIFTYGGCRGNGNRFRSAQECVAACGGRIGESALQSPFALETDLERERETETEAVLEGMEETAIQTDETAEGQISALQRITPSVWCRGSHQCQSDDCIGHWCEVHGPFNDANEAHSKLRTQDCCPHSTCGGNSIGYRMGACTIL